MGTTLTKQHLRRRPSSMYIFKTKMRVAGCPAGFIKLEEALEYGRARGILIRQPLRNTVHVSETASKHDCESD